MIRTNTVKGKNKFTGIMIEKFSIKYYLILSKESQIAMN